MMKSDRLIIGVSKLKDKYASWLKMLHPGVELLDFYTMEDEAFDSVSTGISGLLLSGGDDLHPGFYGRNDCADLCIGIDKKRDETDLRLAKAALADKIPILAICRGMQVLHVALGGTLIVDIPEYAPGSVNHKAEEDVNHLILVKENTVLHEILQSSRVMVNSAHHQAVEKVAEPFIISAKSEDGIIEGMEIADSSMHPFCVAVQWHPERMDIEEPGSGLLGKRFIEEAMRRC